MLCTEWQRDASSSYECLAAQPEASLNKVQEPRPHAGGSSQDGALEMAGAARNDELVWASDVKSISRKMSRCEPDY